MKIKVGDTVKIITGKDKGKTGQVIKTLKQENKVVVDGINIIKKHAKPTRMNESGSIIEIEAPIHVSNVKLVTKSEIKDAKKAKKTKIKEEKIEGKVEKKTAKKTSKKASK